LQECGYLRLYERRYDDAVKLLDQALALHRSGLPDSDPDLAATRLLLGRALMRSERHLDARPHLEAAYQVRGAVFGDAGVPTTMARSALGWCLLRCGEVDKADAML
ncbi:unnamed protein product, partial [Discosporangium mesarthrocarpum]